MGTYSNPAVRTRKYEVVSCSIVADSNRLLPSKIVSRHLPMKSARKLANFDQVQSKTRYSRKPVRLIPPPIWTNGPIPPDYSHRSKAVEPNASARFSGWMDDGHCPYVPPVSWFESGSVLIRFLANRAIRSDAIVRATIKIRTAITLRS